MPGVDVNRAKVPILYFLEVIGQREKKKILLGEE
jgi:hypothetical protein